MPEKQWIDAVSLPEVLVGIIADQSESMNNQMACKVLLEVTRRADASKLPHTYYAMRDKLGYSPLERVSDDNRVEDSAAGSLRTMLRTR